jgi:hypothetical protein
VEGFGEALPPQDLFISGARCRLRRQRAPEKGFLGGLAALQASRLVDDRVNRVMLSEAKYLIMYAPHAHGNLAEILSCGQNDSDFFASVDNSH